MTNKYRPNQQVVCIKSEPYAQMKVGSMFITEYRHRDTPFLSGIWLKDQMIKLQHVDGELTPFGQEYFKVRGHKNLPDKG